MSKNKIFSFFVAMGLFLIVGFGLASASDPFWSSSPTIFPEIQIYAEFDKLEVTPGEVTTLIIRGFMEPGWHIYSVKQQGEFGPKPTSVSFETVHQAMGELEETPPQVIEDLALGLRLAVHKEAFVLTQKIKIVSQASPALDTFDGILHYQICDNNICAPLQHQSFSTPLTVKL